MDFFTLLLLMAGLFFFHQVISRVFLGVWPWKMLIQASPLTKWPTVILASLWLAGSLVLSAAIWYGLLSFLHVSLMWTFYALFEVLSLYRLKNLKKQVIFS